MIKTWEELGETLADIENRLSLIENSQHTHEPPPGKEPEPEWTQRQWGVVNQLRTEIRSWRTKYNETLVALEKMETKRKKYKYQ